MALTIGDPTLCNEWFEHPLIRGLRCRCQRPIGHSEGVGGGGHFAMVDAERWPRIVGWGR